MTPTDRIRNRLRVLLRMTDTVSGYGPVRDLAGIVVDLTELVDKQQRRILALEQKRKTAKVETTGEKAQD